MPTKLPCEKKLDTTPHRALSSNNRFNRGRTPRPPHLLHVHHREQIITRPCTLACCSARTPTLGDAASLENASSSGWHPLEQPLIWQGSESEAMSDLGLPRMLNPPWKVILLSDGSVTRHLQLMTNLDVKVECLEMRDLPEDVTDLPPGVEQISGPLLQRQVFLRRPPGPPQNGDSSGGLGMPLVYAASWWNAAEARQYLQRREQPIWVSLQGTELRRDIQRVCYGNSRFLEQELGVDGPFWGRQYVFWHGGKPLTVIYEVFSPRLQEYLGPISG